MPAEAVLTGALHRFNALPDDEARAALLSCCASPAWAAQVLAGRPFPSPDALLDAAEARCRALSPAEVDAALAGHPRIGDRVAGASREAAWSRQEQASVGGAGADLQQALLEGNLAYEERFGRVFLIRAAGRTPAQMLGELQRRLGNDPQTEAGEVVDQLAQITRLRVAKLLEA